MSQIQVCVFCGSRSGSHPAYAEAAHRVARELATRRMRLVFGAGGGGLMGATARAALEYGVPVTGIIPTFLINQETPVNDLSELIIVNDMHERKAKMAERADLFIVLPGGIGTLEEASEMLTGNWIGQYHKPVGFLNINGFYDKLFAFFENAAREGFMPATCLQRVISDSSVTKLFDKLIAAKYAPALPLNAECLERG